MNTPTHGARHHNGSGYAAALRRLPSAQKSASGAPAYSRFVNRKAGGYLAAAAYQVGATPNQVTALSAVFTFSAILAVAIVPPSVPLGIGVCLSLLIGYALDSADGQLARLRGGGSTAGEWLDHVVDSGKISAMHLAILVSAFRFFDLPRGYLIVPTLFVIVETVRFFATILNDLLRRSHRARTANRSDVGAAPTTQETRSPSGLYSLLVVPTDYGLFCIAFVLLGFPEMFAIVYGLLFLANTVFLVLALRKWFNGMNALDAPEAPTARGISAAPTTADQAQYR